MKFLHFSALSISLLASPLAAQNVQFLDTINPDVISIVQNAPRQLVFSISGERRTDDHVVVADQIVFETCDSRLVFTNVDAPYLVIATPRLRFRDAACRYSIERDRDIVGQSGSNGANGPNGDPTYVHHRGSSGRHGGHGGPGQAGGSGATVWHPPVYLIVGDIEAQEGNALNVGMTLLFHGIGGGDGGDGGNGGRGGTGEKGSPGSDRILSCHAGPGRGGNAGNGGAYGQGGAAGNGGNGADIFLVARDEILDTLTYSRFGNRGGFPGEPGSCGRSGNPGLTGDQGALSTYCRSGGGPGAQGVSPPRPGNCMGSTGQHGEDGRVFAVTTTVDDWFENE